MNTQTPVLASRSAPKPIPIPTTTATSATATAPNFEPSTPPPSSPSLSLAIPPTPGTPGSSGTPRRGHRVRPYSAAPRITDVSTAAVVKSTPLLSGVLIGFEEQLKKDGLLTDFNAHLPDSMRGAAENMQKGKNNDPSVIALTGLKEKLEQTNSKFVKYAGAIQSDLAWFQTNILQSDLGVVLSKLEEIRNKPPTNVKEVLYWLNRLGVYSKADLQIKLIDGYKSLLDVDPTVEPYTVLLNQLKKHHVNNDFLEKAYSKSFLKAFTSSSMSQAGKDFYAQLGLAVATAEKTIDHLSDNIGLAFRQFSDTTKESVVNEDVKLLVTQIRQISEDKKSKFLYQQINKLNKFLDGLIERVLVTYPGQAQAYLAWMPSFRNMVDTECMKLISDIGKSGWEAQIYTTFKKFYDQIASNLEMHAQNSVISPCLEQVKNWPSRYCQQLVTEWQRAASVGSLGAAKYWAKAVGDQLRVSQNPAQLLQTASVDIDYSQTKKLFGFTVSIKRDPDFKVAAKAVEASLTPSEACSSFVNLKNDEQKEYYLRSISADTRRELFCQLAQHNSEVFNSFIRKNSFMNIVGPNLQISDLTIAIANVPETSSTKARIINRIFHTPRFLFWNTGYDFRKIWKDEDVSAKQSLFDLVKTICPSAKQALGLSKEEPTQQASPTKAALPTTTTYSSLLGGNQPALIEAGSKKPSQPILIPGNLEETEKVAQIPTGKSPPPSYTT